MGIAERGQATLESTAVMGLLVTFAMLFLGLGYLVFARVWLRFTAEQTLYCLAENRSVSSCREETRRRTAQALPAGHLARININRRPANWLVDLEWQWNGLDVRIARRLELSSIKRTKQVLR